MQVEVLSLPKTLLDNISDSELAFYVHVGHLRNKSRRGVRSLADML